VLECCLSNVSGLTDALYSQINRRATTSSAGFGALSLSLNGLSLFDSNAPDARGVFVLSAEQRAELQIFAQLPVINASIQSSDAPSSSSLQSRLSENCVVAWQLYHFWRRRRSAKISPG
jgi:hypothetical protein